MRITDPRGLLGDIAGPGGPHDWGQNIVDASHAILLDGVTASTLDPDDGGERGVALLLEGRINQREERGRVLFIMGTDGASAIITEIVALLGRARAMDADGFLTDLVKRIEKLRADGNLS
jgi:hypothetical protein